jgi:cytochrome c553
MTMTKPRFLHTALLMLCLAALPLTATAKGDPKAGKTKSTTCQACHGVDGKAIAPEYPNLGGQYESYLVKALRDYRDGRRTNPVMGPMAAGLSDEDIEDLAAWYASQKGLKDLSFE